MNRGVGYYLLQPLNRCLYAALLTGMGLLVCQHLALAQQPTIVAHAPTDVSRPAEELLARHVTITLHRVSLERAIDSISRVANVFVEYQAPTLEAYTTPVTVSVTDVPLGIVFERVLDGTGLGVIAGGRGKLIIAALSGSHVDSLPQAGTVVGVVVDSATGRGLAGVTIRATGTKIVVVTRDSGRFALKNVPAGTQLFTARVFGYRAGERTVDVTAGLQKTVRFVLSTVPTELSGVVTTATGVQRKIEVGNDITTLNADSLMKVAPISSVTDMLENRVPGLTVLHSSGVPGDPSRIRLRGAGSLTGNNDPIVIIDGVRVYASQSDARNASLAQSYVGGSSTNGGKGVTGGVGTYAVPSPLDQIDPNSIETVEVFKGPSASALYGSDAANGVIVITTKKGRAGPTHWSMNLGAGLSYQPGDWPVNYYRFGYGQSSAVGSPFCAWNDLSCKVDSIVPYQALNDPRYKVFADHGSDQSVALAVSGGSPTLQYSLTGSAAGNLGILQMPAMEQQRFLNQYGYAMPNGMVRPDRYNTLGGSGQVTVQPIPKATVTVISSLYDSKQQRSSLEQAPTQLEGEYINPLILGAGNLLLGEYERATSTSLTLTNALNINWSPVSWLPLMATAGLHLGQRVDETYVPYGIYESFTNAGGLDSNGSFGYGRGLTFDKTLNIGTTIPLRGVTVGVGANYHAGSTDDFSAQTDTLAPGVSEPSTFPNTNTNVTSGLSRSSSDAATYGWYFEPRLNIASRFFVAPGFRLDGGSASGSSGGVAGSGLTGFPKIDLSYVMVDRQEDPLWGVVSLFRPRLALGIAGTQPGPAEKLRLFNASQNTSNTTGYLYRLNGTLVPASFLSTLGNTRLQPEQSRELEGGFETDLWRNRLTLTYTRYDKVRHNAILSIPVASSVYGSGLSYNVNIGEVKSTGTEVTTNVQVLQGQALSWNVGMNLSQRNEKLVRLNPGEPSQIVGNSTAGSVTLLVPGYPLWGRWAYPVASYIDANHDGILENSELRYGDSLVYIGQQTPKYTMAFNSDLSLFHGTLGVHASASYESGFTQFNDASITSGSIAQLANAPGATFATQASVLAATGTRQSSAIGVIQTVSALRFQSLSINYQIPRTISQRLRVPRIQCALQGSNLGLHTNYRGLDPNVNAFSTSGTGGDQSADTGQLPEPRTWSLHIILGN